MTRMNVKKLICLFLAVILTISLVPPLPTVAEAQAQEKTHDELLRDVMAGVLTMEEAFGPLDADTVPEIVGYDSAVARKHLKRMYEEEGDNLNKVIFLNADGTRTAYYYDHPVKYVDTKGKIKDISLEIAQTDVAGQFKTAANSAVTTFSRNAADGIGLKKDSAEISLVPHLPAAKTMTATKATANAVAQKINKKTVAYTYDDKTTLEYSLTYTGFKEDIVVREYTGQTAYDFTLYTNGLKLTKKNDTFFLVDAAGTEKARLGEIIILTADNRNNTMGDMVARTVVENQEYLLTILVDPEFLADEKTSYPIRIDPTIEFTYDNNGAGAIEDVTINSGTGSDGASNYLYCGLRPGNGIARFLMKFPALDLDSLDTDSETDIVITNAQVELRDVLCGEDDMEVLCHVFSGNQWTEATANWSNVSPNSMSTLLSWQTISYNYGIEQPTAHTYAFDITAAVDGWRTGACDPEKGIIFTAQEGVEHDSVYLSKAFSSFNHWAYKPTLTVTYETGAIYNCVRNYTTDTFCLWVDWPLLDEIDITHTQANAIAWAFTDFIWEKLQDE